jgi:hypothetical protein
VTGPEPRRRGVEQVECPRCGTPHGPEQEYCLECGLRLQRVPGVVGRLSKAWSDRFAWYPGDWIWPSLLFGVLAIAGAGAAIALAAEGGSGGPIIATEGGAPHSPTNAPETGTVALPSVPRGTPTSGPPATPTVPPPASSRPRPADALTAWPAGQSGYTVVLESIPVSAGRPLAVSRARSAARSGLPQVGVLDSSRYSSLHPGYYVVFSGIYDSAAEAARNRSQALAEGYPVAYPRQITR